MKTITTEGTLLKYRPVEPQCKRCKSYRIGQDNGSHVCFDCGLHVGQVVQFQPCINDFVRKKNSYKRQFYFNERISRWKCEEPVIHYELLALIKKEAEKKKYGNLRKKCRRRTIIDILRNVHLTEEMQEKHRSKKFLKSKLTQKRFFNKYSEKWKSIRSILSKKKPLIPSQELVDKMKVLFIGTEEPFEDLRHVPECDGRARCTRYFKCWHNFINYDFLFRKFLQLCEVLYGFNDCYELFKHEFPLVSKDLRDRKLRPMWFKVCQYNGWPKIEDE